MIHRLYPPPDVNNVLSTGLVTQFGGVPVLGDLIEVFTGVEDGDLTDIATWVNTLLDAAAGLGIVLDVIGDILGFITGFIPGSGDAKQKLAGVINSKAALTAVPIDSPLWHSMSRDEETTFPRSTLNFGAASSTSSGGSTTANAHTHGLGQVPDYQPSGNNTDYLEIGFIRISVDASTSKIGFITGNNNTFAGITGAYVGFFSQASNGNLTLLNPTTAATNIKSSITQQNTEFVFDLGLTIDMLQGEVYAIGILQDTSVIQTAASLMRTTQTNLNRASSGEFPRKGYAYAGTYSSMPSSITEANLHYDASTKIPFYFIQRDPA